MLIGERPRWAVILAVGAMLLGVTAFVRARPDEGSAPADSSEPSEVEKPSENPKPTADPLGNLDDLLGIPEDQRNGPRGDPQQPGAELDSSRTELDKRLSGQQIADQFRQAIAEMGEAADRMARAGDVGVKTQRLQQQILTKLDVLIKEKKNSGQKGGKSSQQKQGQQGQKQSPAQPQPGKSGQNQAGKGENRGEVDPPGFQSPELRRALDLARASWGSLPERIRNALIEGLTGDTRSSLYEDLTDEYYRRLAEDRDQ